MNASSYESSSDLTLSGLPSQIGPYLIERLIERGPLHESYRGFDSYKNIAVFIKRLRASSLQQIASQARENFSREVRLLRTINHPHIAHLVQAGMESGRPYLVCHYIEGLSLRDFILYEWPRPSEAFHILKQIASALSYLHKREIIHNDLKPENILVTPTLEATLIDFGIAQSLERVEDRKIQQLAGTLLYMSPEQQTQQLLSAASDLYSFAIIAFELITGRLSQGTIQLALLPIKLQPLFAKALHQQPLQRFKSVEEFFLALESAKASIAGIHIPMRRNEESPLLIDLEDKKFALSNHLELQLHFCPSHSFHGQHQLFGVNEVSSVVEEPSASLCSLVFIDLAPGDRHWLYYFKAHLDLFKAGGWHQEPLAQFLYQLCERTAVRANMALIEIDPLNSSENQESLSLRVLLLGDLLLSRVLEGETDPSVTATLPCTIAPLLSLTGGLVKEELLQESSAKALVKGSSLAPPVEGLAEGMIDWSLLPFESRSTLSLWRELSFDLQKGEKLLLFPRFEIEMIPLNELKEELSNFSHFTLPVYAELTSRRLGEFKGLKLNRDSALKPRSESVAVLALGFQDTR